MSATYCPPAAGNSGLSYANDVTLSAFARHLRELVQKRSMRATPRRATRSAAAPIL